ELDEGVVYADRTAGDRARIGVVRRASTGAAKLRVDRGARGSSVARVGVGRPGEGRIEEGADHAIFGRGARIDVEVFTRTGGVVVRQAVLSAALSGICAVVHRVRIERGFDAQIATQLDAGVSARDVVESGTIQG